MAVTQPTANASSVYVSKLSFLHTPPSHPSLVSMIHGQSHNHITTTTNPLILPAFAAAAASASTFLGAPGNHSFPQYHPRQITPLLSLPSFPTPTNSDLYSVRSATRDQQPAQSSRRGRKNTRDEKEITARVDKLLVHFFQEDQAKPLKTFCTDAALPNSTYHSICRRIHKYSILTKLMNQQAKNKGFTKKMSMGAASVL